ncbi:flagellar hook protein FlgE [Candidatus Galacturonibacter soehngenii]|uniref:Flagellar hook protein FlgE n=1 Tax=Candidatus Galacturonatibacter soehngenii TaxID=2307010 RepID=A0A7V7UB37_9FIRM|nr:flagellar hook-basal body complex protein [Candidatus Galacturonibacter soehngenii]KAB1437703.1 flagellar hook-basal body complex protein [Candidatus Galacturonibacter soehngenii]
MMRSLYSGVSGLKTHQTKMDVIGNNIANVNTVGYKSQNVTFQDVMYQTISFASGPNPNTGAGGVNAKQIGLGVTTGAISTTITTSGATQTTNNPFDIRITGDSFFVVNNGTQNYFTKAGNFTIDSAGNLVMSTTGYNVMGWQVVDGEIVKGTVSPLKLMATANLTSAPEATTKANFSGVVDKENSDVNSAKGYVSNLEFYDALGYAYKANFTLHNAEGLTDAGGNLLPEGSFYMSLDDILDGENASVLASSGATFGSTLNFTDADGNPVTVNNAILVTYNQADGTLSAIDGTAGATTSMLSFGTGPDQQKFSNITVDFSGSQMKGNKGVMSANILKGDANKDGTGRLLGKMIGISISNDGKIYGSYSNGDDKLLGQIAVAEFSNPSGLSKEGQNLYSATLNSGDFDGIGIDITANNGSMATGVLEMSNVDLSSEFTEMITTQRGFQANSRIITVSDTMIEELVNLKRG